MMTEVILNTGWKYWDRYLSRFVGKKINCLDIGSYTGESTCWMLNNLCTNPYSRVFSVDTWEGSAEYTNYTNEIEKQFDEAVEKTGKKDQHVKMKMQSSKALIKLKEFGFIIFDFIFIDSSHEGKDVITDAILSWDILNEGGILIFDDYKSDKLKLVIDTFATTFKSNLKILYSGYQYIVQKINIRDYAKPELEDYYKLVDDINKYKFDNFEYVFEDVIEEEIEFKLETSNSLNQEIKIISQINKDISNYDLLGKVLDISSSYWIYHLLDSTINDKLIISIYSYLNINKNNMMQFNYINIYLYKYLISINKNINVFINYDIFNIDLFLETFKSINTNYKIELILKNKIINNYTIYDKLISKTNKYDMIMFGFIYKLNDREFNKLENIILIIYIGIALNIQKKNGSLIIYVPYYINNNLFIESIFLLKKYYKKIIIYNLPVTNIGSQFLIYCHDFLTIIESDKQNINKLINKIFINIDNNNINSYICNNKIKDYNKVCELILNNKYNNVKQIINLYNNIYLYININKNRKLYIQRLLLIKLTSNLIYNYSKY